MREITIRQQGAGVEIELNNPEHLLANSVEIPNSKLAVNDGTLESIKRAVALLLYWEERKLKGAPNPRQPDLLKDIV